MADRAGVVLTLPLATWPTEVTEARVVGLERHPAAIIALCAGSNEAAGPERALGERDAAAGLRP